MLAVILKMKPVNLGSSGCTSRSSALTGRGLGAISTKQFQQFLHTEIIQRRTEEDRSHLALQIVVNIEFGINTLDQFQLAAQLSARSGADPLVQFLGMDVHFHLLRHYLFGGGRG